jgi:hypothetical protein
VRHSRLEGQRWTWSRRSQEKPLLTAAQVRALRELHQQRLESLKSVDRGVAAIVGALRAAGELPNLEAMLIKQHAAMNDCAGEGCRS